MAKGIFSEKNKGFTMVEMMIATFILVTAIIASYYAFSRMLVATSLISSKLTAAYLAQEGIEIIRNMRDTDWLMGKVGDAGWGEIKDALIPLCSAGCEADYTTGTENEEFALRSYYGDFLNIDSNNFYSYSAGGSATKFKRKITIASLSSDPANVLYNVLDISVLIEWEDRGESYNFTAEERLYNWYKPPTP